MLVHIFKNMPQKSSVPYLDFSIAPDNGQISLTHYFILIILIYFFSYQKSSVLFNQDKLSVIHLYPSESSFLDETDSTGQFSKTEDAINNERLRMKTVDTDAPAVTTQVETIENVNFVTEGGDFNSFSNDEEGASALLF